MTRNNTGSNFKNDKQSEPNQKIDTHKVYTVYISSYVNIQPQRVHADGKLCIETI